MNEELQKALAQILNKSVSAAEAGASFLQRELPEVIQQLLMWKAVESAIYCLLSLAGFIVSILVTKKAWKAIRELDEGVEPLIIFPAAATAFSLFSAFGHTDWLKILIAPKLYLIEFAASLAK